jgi:hypothetical protein
MINRVTLLGNCAKDTESIDTQGKPMARLRIATNSQWRDSNGERHEQSEFHSVVAFDKLATIAVQYCTQRSGLSSLSAATGPPLRPPGSLTRSLREGPTAAPDPGASTAPGRQHRGAGQGLPRQARGTTSATQDHTNRSLHSFRGLPRLLRSAPSRTLEWHSSRPRVQRKRAGRSMLTREEGDSFSGI